MNMMQLRETVDRLFTDRLHLTSYWQEVADNFYPERADFTVTRTMGDDFAEDLSTSYPLIVRRELGNQFGMMLRPLQKDWFYMATEEEIKDNDARKWLEWATKIQRRAMYDRRSQFVRATKEGDHDFAAFGQTIISVRLNKNADGLLYRCWHLRDVVWRENEEGEIGLIGRTWKPARRDLLSLFPGKCHSSVSRDAEKDPFGTVKCYHIICEADMYDDDARNKPYFSIYYDCDHDHIMEVVPVFNREYVIPRWQTVSGSQYAYSPATVAALPDARLIQSMTYTLLEAGEKATNPPMVATQDAVKSDISIYAGGVTWVDELYDERLGEALRPIAQDLRGLPMGIEMSRDARAMIHEAFYLNKLTLPERAPEMTAYEVGQRIQEYIRGALPIFEPMEMEYNGAICEQTFEIMLRAGGFGSIQNMPAVLHGQEVQFKFESPLHDAIEMEKNQKWIESRTVLADAVAMDPSSAHMVDIKKALRDVLSGLKVPAEWLRSEIETERYTREMERQMAEQQQLDRMQQSSEISKNMSEASA